MNCEGPPDRLSWSALRQMNARSMCEEGRRDAVDWTIDTLERHLGSHWPENAATAGSAVCQPLALLPFHAVAFATWLEFALRLELFAEVSGIAKLRKTTRDSQLGSWLHARTTLEVAALARSYDATVSFEPTVVGTAGPADVHADFGNGVVLDVEVHILLTSKRFRDVHDHGERIQSRATHVGHAHRVALHVDASTVATDREVSDLLAAMDDVAIAARLCGDPALIVTDSGASVTAEPVSTPPAFHEIVYPTYLEHDGWRRIGGSLAKKARKYATAEAVWLRLDLLDGTTAFSDWAREDPSAQLELLANAAREELSSFGAIAGVVISSGGLGLDAATDDDPATVTFDGATRISRSLPFFRRRVTFVVPFRAGHDADTLTSMYAREHEWLAAALDAVRPPGWRSLLR